MSFLKLLPESPYFKSHVAFLVVVLYLWLSNYTNVLAFSFAGYLFLRMVLTTGEEAMFGDQRRKPTWKQQALPNNIIADFEYHFVPSREPCLAVSSDAGTGTYAQTVPLSKSVLTVLEKAESGENGEAIKQSEYAGTGYTPATNALISPRDASPGAGRLLFSQSFRIKNKKPKAVIIQFHGFGDHTSWYLRDEAVMWAQRGFAVHAIDSYGNGRSDGLQNFIPSLKDIVEDFSVVIQRIKTRYSPDTKFFIVGHSMGGALALHVAWRIPEIVNGLILIAPMVKIVESLKPPKPVVKALEVLASVWPTGPVTPLPDLIHHCFESNAMLECRLRDPIRLKIKSRLGSALEMVRVTDELDGKLDKVSVPFVVVHGRNDKVTACDVSEALYRRASSTDKKFIKLEGALHCVFQYNGIAHTPSIRLFDELAEWAINRS